MASLNQIQYTQLYQIITKGHCTSALTSRQEATAQCLDSSFEIKLVIKMKKWKLLHEIDKHSGTSSKFNKSKGEDTFEKEPKGKAYVPFRRSRNVSGDVSAISHSSSEQFFLPNMERFIRSSDILGKADYRKLKTEMDEIEQLKFGASLGEVQGKNSPSFTKPQNTERSSLKQGQLYGHPLQRTERLPFRQTDARNKDQEPQSTNLKQISNVWSLHKKVSTLAKDQKNLKKTAMHELTNFGQQIKAFEKNWNKKVQEVSAKSADKNASLDVLEQILEQYDEYQIKAEELEEQKQVFLQNLGRMAPAQTGYYE